MLSSSRQIAVFSTYTEGTLVERMAVKIDTFLDIDVYLPATIEEQKKIAIVLDKADRENCIARKAA